MPKCLILKVSHEAVANKIHASPLLQQLLAFHIKHRRLTTGAPNTLGYTQEMQYLMLTMTYQSPPQKHAPNLFKEFSISWKFNLDYHNKYCYILGQTHPK